MAERHRLFVALPVPAWVRESVEAAVAPLREEAPQLRWVAPDRWHLTVAFLGGVEAPRVPAVAGALAGAVADSPNPTLTLDGTAGTFKGRVLWARIVADDDLEALVATVAKTLEPLGFSEDKPFRGHLTLARAATDGQVPRRLADAYHGPASRWRADLLHLMRSRPGPEGSRYDTVASWPLS